MKSRCHLGRFQVPSYKFSLEKRERERKREREKEREREREREREVNEVSFQRSRSPHVLVQEELDDAGLLSREILQRMVNDILKQGVPIPVHPLFKLHKPTVERENRERERERGRERERERVRERERTIHVNISDASR